VPSYYSSEGLSKTTQKKSVTKACLWVNVWTCDLLNTKQKWQWYNWDVRYNLVGCPSEICDTCYMGNLLDSSSCITTLWTITSSVSMGISHRKQTRFEVLINTKVFQKHLNKLYPI
jgi:hypothetical protein